MNKCAICLKCLKAENVPVFWRVEVLYCNWQNSESYKYANNSVIILTRCKSTGKKKINNRQRKKKYVGKLFQTWKTSKSYHFVHLLQIYASLLFLTCIILTTQRTHTSETSIRSQKITFGVQCNSMVLATTQHLPLTSMDSKRLSTLWYEPVVHVTKTFAAQTNNTILVTKWLLP